jgi:exonuclease V gamma subunit
MEKTYLSNHLDVLLENLKINLFSNFSFSSRKIVFVPNIYIKNYLMQKIAEDKRFKAISFISFFDIKNFSKSFSKNFLEENSLKTPTFLELSLLIEENILKFLKNSDKDFSKVSFYLNFKEKDFSHSKKKLRSLTDRLTHYFFLYGIYGKKEEINWQIKLFEEIFKELNNPIKQFSNPKFLPLSKKMELHFFAVFFMPKIFRKVLKKLKKVPIHHYLLSPCIYFWEDICSSKKRKFIKKNFKTSEEFNNYLKNTNLLLANMGKIQRDYLRILMDEEMEIFENYVEEEKDF